jgi:hypothetical protein
MAKRKSFEEKNKYIHPTRKKVIDTVFGRDGNTQKTFGYEGDELKKREIGETWTDSSGVTWEQKDGYKTTVSKLDDVRQYLSSLKECKGTDCQTKIFSKIDKKIIIKTGMCVDCLQKYETQLKVDGTYPFYEDYKMTRNKLAYARELKQRYEAALDGIKDTIEFVNERGEIETWKWEIEPEKVRQDLINDIQQVSHAIELLIERKAKLEDKLVELKHSELIVK